MDETNDVHDLAAPYALDAVDEQERAEFERHLAGCAECRALVAELTDAAVDLSAGLEEAPPEHLRERVLAQAAAEPRGADPEVTSLAQARADRERTTTGDAAPEPRSGAGHRRPRRPVARWLVAAAAAAVVGVGAWGVSRTLTQDPLDQVVSADDASEHTAAADEGDVVVITSASAEGAVLRLPADLPPPEEGRVYQAWFVQADGSARSAGVLSEETLASGEGLLDGSPEGAGAVGLSVEPVGGSEQPTTDPFVVVPLG